MRANEVRHTSLMVQVLLMAPLLALASIAMSAPHMGMTGYTSEGEVRMQHLTQVLLNVGLCILCGGSLAHVYFVGITTRFKIFVLLGGLIYCLASSIVWSTAPYHILIIPLVTVAHVLRTERDAKVLDGLAVFCLVAQLAFLVVSVWKDSNLLSWHSHEKTNHFGLCISTMIPPVMNHLSLKFFLRNLGAEHSWTHHTLSQTHKATEFLANFDLDNAAEVLCGGSSHTSVSRHSRSSLAASEQNEPLRRLLVNLRSYKVFLPQALFASECDHPAPPNELLAATLAGTSTKWETLTQMVERLRDPAYSLKAFQEDVELTFPELCLYDVQDSNRLSMVSKMSSGLTGTDETQRTMSALFSVYCLCRLDIDGKEVFSFGVDDNGDPCMQPKGDEAEKRQAFYDNMAWDRAQDLMIRAGVMDSNGSRYEIQNERATALLVLTVVHDVMKNNLLLPVVQPQHKEYCGYRTGETINDHDVALAYILEHFPHLLPSYYGLEPSLRAPILFTQGKMGFNNGWLVQGEAPPNALFNQFKTIIVQGRACSADVSLYFLHWLTDLAGAVPYGTGPWPGAEKFTTKFPVKVLSTFLDSFGFMDELANSSEVQVMESYLESRWKSLGSPPPQISSEAKVAAMRLSLMAQGFERDCISKFEDLPEADKCTISTEYAMTGCREQFMNSPSSTHERTCLGPVLLVYYAPALIQKANASQCSGALHVLAEVMRASRILFPARASSIDDFVTIRIDALKVRMPEDIMQRGAWHLKKIGPMEAEVAPGWASKLLDSESAKADLQRWGSKLALRSGTRTFAHDTDVFAAADLDLSKSKGLLVEEVEDNTDRSLQHKDAHLNVPS